LTSPCIYSQPPQVHQAARLPRGPRRRATEHGANRVDEGARDAAQGGEQGTKGGKTFLYLFLSFFSARRQGYFKLVLKSVMEPVLTYSFHICWLRDESLALFLPLSHRGGACILSPSRPLTSPLFLFLHPPPHTLTPCVNKHPQIQYLLEWCCEQVRNAYTQEFMCCEACGKW
jgi:hypothetical protein